MKTLLITGASGFIGKALAETLSADYRVVCISRKDPRVPGITYVRGDFAAFEDLSRLDSFQFDAVVHLAAVTGGCLERDGVLVNCEGTRCLMRYLIDHGCKKFVMASSIAVVGIQNMDFRPLVLPIPDDHPCLDRDGYGFSKHLMEQVTLYYQRQNPDLDIINLRLASIAPEDARPQGLRPLGPWSAGSITVMLLSDTIRLIILALEAPFKPGVRTMNATCEKAWTTVPTAQILQAWWGEQMDVGHYERAGHEFNSIYDVSTIGRELGFRADNTLKVLNDLKARV